MRFIIILFVFCFLLSGFQLSDRCKDQLNAEVKHIFIHSLIAYPEILKKKNQATIDLYYKDCIDYLQFKKLLCELYKNNYCLVDINKTFSVDEKGNARKEKIILKNGKRPLVISVDDVVYDNRKSGNGMADRLCVDSQGRIYTETYINGTISQSYDREFAPILEDFIIDHPDFSFDNSRVTINLTGFCGVLGYRITSDNKNIAISETKKASKVVNRLKELGYTFACHSYGHYHMKKVSEEYIKQDLLDWKNKIEPIIGKTNIFAFPYGEWEISNCGKMSNKQRLLCDAGFKLFLGVGIYDFYSYMPLCKCDRKILFWDRKNIDNFSLKHRSKELSSLFDTKKILNTR